VDSRSTNWKCGIRGHSDRGLNPSRSAKPLGPMGRRRPWAAGLSRFWSPLICLRDDTAFQGLADGARGGVLSTLVVACHPNAP
jgi:hypothetical protein